MGDLFSDLFGDLIDDWMLQPVTKFDESKIKRVPAGSEEISASGDRAGGKFAPGDGLPAGTSLKVSASGKFLDVTLMRGEKEVGGVWADRTDGPPGYPGVQSSRLEREYRAKGVGLRLYAELAALAAREGFKGISSEYHTRNDNSNRMWIRARKIPFKGDRWDILEPSDFPALVKKGIEPFGDELIRKDDSDAAREYTRHPEGVKVDRATGVGGGRFASPGHVATPTADQPAMATPARTWVQHGVFTSGPNKGQPLPTDTLTYYEGDKEREKLRDAMIAKVVDGHETQEHPTLVVMVGGTASGKGTLRDAYLEEMLSRGKKFAVVDSDAFKEGNEDLGIDGLPEYHMAIDQEPGSGDRISSLDAAAIVHEESSWMAGEATNQALQRKINFVYDGTGKSADRYLELIDQAKARGYTIEAIIVHNEYEIALPRMLKRAEQKGRMVPPPIMEKTYAGIKTAVPQYIDGFDEITVYDTRGKSPKLAWRKTGTTNNVYDPQLVGQYGSKKHIQGAKLVGKP